MTYIKPAITSDLVPLPDGLYLARLNERRAEMACEKLISFQTGWNATRLCCFASCIETGSDLTMGPLRNAVNAEHPNGFCQNHNAKVGFTTI